MLGLIQKVFGTANDRIVKRLRKEVEIINSYESGMQKLSDSELKAKTEELKQKYNQTQDLDMLTYEAFAVVREAARRVLKMRHFDVQLVGGLILHRGKITEMRTGEGKTLVATLPAYLNALTGKGVHIVTVNDYLAKRDSEWMGKIYEFLGLSVACITNETSDKDRKAAYNSDITYATNNELGFDYLRDNMKFSLESKVQRPFNYAIIDEVDSILIDEARTPLIISGPVDDNSELYTIMDAVVKHVKPELYELDEKSRSVNLNDAGIEFIEAKLKSIGLLEGEEASLYDFANMHLVHYINQALRAHTLFKKDVDYMIQNGQVMIIDEFTGRIMDGRRYSEGLHQALEAKESVKIQNENQTLASITFQNYFRMYPKLAGMTGTAMTEAAEFREIYKLDVITVPTHHPIKRQDHDDAIYGSISDKYEAILQNIKECHAKGQPVLVGTISIEKSEEISKLLAKANLPHAVLNAKYHAQEAQIIAQAGRYGAITIATNMAGRGTDIMLGGNADMRMQEEISAELSDKERKAAEEKIIKEVEAEKEKVKAAGGLYIIGTERHESRRIDNQLRGRSGRQGDPGDTQFYLSLEDDLMRIFASEKISGLLRTLGLKDGEAIHHPMISRALEKAQTKVEAHNYEIRKTLLKYDDVMNDQRKVIFEQRNEIITSESVHDILENMAAEVAEIIVSSHIPSGSYREDWDIEGLCKEIHRVFGVYLNPSDISEANVTEEDIVNKIIAMSKELFEAKLKDLGEEVMREGEKYVLLTSLDTSWKDHLHTLDYLRQGISLRAYGQKDPLNEYKREAFNLFERMLDGLRYTFIQRMSHLHTDKHYNAEELSLKRKQLQKIYQSHNDPAFSKYNAGAAISSKALPIKKAVAPEERDPTNPETWGKISRNEVCPCGSGAKYKYCHGKVD